MKSSSDQSFADNAYRKSLSIGTDRRAVYIQIRLLILSKVVKSITKISTVTVKVFHCTELLWYTLALRLKTIGKHRQRPANIVICRRQHSFVPANELSNDRIRSLTMTHDVCRYLPICPSLPFWLLDLKNLPCQHQPLYHARFALMNVVKCPPQMCKHEVRKSGCL